MSQQYSYGAPAPGGYGAPPPQQQQHGYGAPPAQQGYGAPPPQQGGGYGAPPAGGSGGYPPQRPQAYNRNTGPPPGANPQLWGWFTSCDRDASGQIDAKELQQALVNGDWSPFDLDTVKMLMGLFDVDRSGHISFNEFAGLWQYIQQWQGVFRHFDQDRSGSIDSSELSRALANFGYNLSPKLIHIVTEKYMAGVEVCRAGYVRMDPVRPVLCFSAAQFSRSIAKMFLSALHNSTKVEAACMAFLFPPDTPDTPVNAPPSADAAAAGGIAQPGRRPAGITFDRFCRACIVIKNLTEGFQRHDTHRTGQANLTYENFMELALSAP